jgi:hypothetical protein
MEQNKNLTKKLVTNIFYNKQIMKKVLLFLEEKSKETLKNCFKRSGWKDKKKQLKEIIKNYIVDFGKHQEKLRHRISDEGSLIINTNVFNINKNFLREFVSVYHKDTEDRIELDKDDLYGYLKVLPNFEFSLVNTKGDFLKLSKAIIPYDTVEETESEGDGDDSKKYEMFYNMNELTSSLPVDFSNKEYLIERQKKILEIMNANKNKIFYPLEFISNVNYWTIILCHGGYFACGFFLKDKVIDHKSDHKYVTRKKAGQRQITKDKAGKVKSSGKFFYF